MKKIIALVIVLAFAVTGLAAVSAGAAEPAQGNSQHAQAVTYQPSTYVGDEATVLLTSGPRVNN